MAGVPRQGSEEPILPGRGGQAPLAHLGSLVFCGSRLCRENDMVHHGSGAV